MKLSDFQSKFLGELMHMQKCGPAEVKARFVMLSARYGVDCKAVLEAIDRNRIEKLRSIEEAEVTPPPAYLD